MRIRKEKGQVHEVRTGYRDDAPLCMCGEWFCPYVLRTAATPDPLRRQLAEAARTLAVATIALMVIVASWTMLIALVLAGARLCLWVVDS